MQYPIFIYWCSGTNPECNNIVARFDKEEEINPFPEDINESFLYPFFDARFDYGYLKEEVDDFLKYYSDLTKLSKYDAIRIFETSEFKQFCDDYFCEDEFYVFCGPTALEMFELAKYRRLRVSGDEFIKKDPLEDQ